MEKFAGYGFNKSHSAAYALIAYQTAYLKAHYPVEFMAALLNSFLSSTDQVVKLINECREKNIEILPPDVNASGKDFTVVDGKIRFGLGAVKNVGETAIEGSSWMPRGTGSFFNPSSISAERVDTQKVNRRVLEQLIKCGAFRIALHATGAGAGRPGYGPGERPDRAAGPSVGPDQHVRPRCAPRRRPRRSPCPDVPDWDSRHHPAVRKGSPGLLYFRTSPGLLCRAAGLPLHCRHPAGEGETGRDRGRPVRHADVIKELTTKKGDRMAFLALEDKEGIVEVVAFSGSLCPSDVTCWQGMSL